MKKNICATIIMFIISAIFIITGCSPKGLQNNPATNAQVVSNGGMSVIKGDYLYYVNGLVNDVTTLDPKYDNKEGDVIHSAIYRTKLVDGQVVKDDEGFLENSERVVSRVVGFKSGGFYIIDDYIYYATPNMNLDKSGKPLNERVVFHRVKIDGTDDKEIYSTPSSETSLDWTCYKVNGKVYILAYLSGSEQTIVSIDTEERKTVAEIKNVTSYAFYKESTYEKDKDRSNPVLKYVYYTRNTAEDDKLPSNYNGNIIARFNVSNGEIEKLSTDGNSSYTIKKVTPTNIYYTRSEPRGTQTSLALLYRQNITSWNYNNEIKMSTVAYTNYYICDFGYDLFIGTTDNATYRVMKNGNNEIVATKIFTSAQTILGIYGGCGYYATESVIYRFDILNGEIEDNTVAYEVSSDDTMTMIVDSSNCIDFDNQRLYVFAEYTSALDESKNYYLNFVEPNSYNQKFVGVFEEDHLPEAPEEEDTDGDGEIDNIPHVK